MIAGEVVVDEEVESEAGLAFALAEFLLRSLRLVCMPWFDSPLSSYSIRPDTFKSF